MPGAWDVAAAGITAILYAATFSAAGGVFFLLYCAPLPQPDSTLHIRQWIARCAAAALFAGVVRLSILAGSLGESVASLADGRLWWMVLQAGEWRATGILVAGLAMMGTMALTARPSVPALLGALAAVSSFALIGHAWAMHPRVLGVSLVLVHLLAIAFWLGALMPLLIIARGAHLPSIAGAARQFSRIALRIVPLLLAAGTLLLWLLLGAFRELWTTAYGRTMLLKLLLVAALLCLAAGNKWILTPRLAAQDPRALASLRRSIGAEIVLAALILVVTAALTTTTGPASPD